VPQIHGNNRGRMRLPIHPPPPPPRWLLPFLASVENLLYRYTGHTFGGMIAGVPVMLLTTQCRRKRAEHTVPVAFLVDGDDFIVVAGNAGSVHNPGWYYNLMACPVATVEIGEVQLEVVASRVKGEELARLWPTLEERLAPLRFYAQRTLTKRSMPVIRLSTHGWLRSLTGKLSLDPYRIILTDQVLPDQLAQATSSK